MKIKILVITLCLTVLCFVSSCNVNTTIGKFSEVNFSDEVKVNFEYNSAVFDALVRYENDCLYFKCCDNCGTLSFTDVTIDSNTYTISSNGLKFNGNTKELNNNFLPYIIFCMLSENGGIAKTEMYDERKGCYYFENNISTNFIRFEIYDNDNKPSYILIIT